MKTYDWIISILLFLIKSIQIPTMPHIYVKTRVINNNSAILALQLDDRFLMIEKWTDKTIVYFTNSETPNYRTLEEEHAERNDGRAQQVDLISAANCVSTHQSTMLRIMSSHSLSVLQSDETAAILARKAWQDALFAGAPPGFLQNTSQKRVDKSPKNAGEETNSENLAQRHLIGTIRRENYHGGRKLDKGVQNGHGDAC